MVHDLIVDTLFEENLIGALSTIGSGRLIMAPTDQDQEAPYLTPEEGYLVVRVKNYDPVIFARELERRVPQMRIVTVVERTPTVK